MYQIFSGTKEGIEDFLNGRMVAGMRRRAGLPVGGLSLVFTTPVASITFSGGAGAVLSAEQIVAEINAVATGLAVLRNKNVAGAAADIGGRPDPGVEVVLYNAAGLTLNDGASTARPFFRFPVSTAAIDQADIVSFQPDAAKGFFHVLVNP